MRAAIWYQIYKIAAQICLFVGCFVWIKVFEVGLLRLSVGLNLRFRVAIRYRF